MPPFLPRTHLERGMDHHAAHEAHLREQREEMRDDTEVLSAQKFLENNSAERREKHYRIWEEFTEILFSGTRDEESYYNGNDDYSFSHLQREYGQSRTIEEGVGHIIRYLAEKIRHPEVKPASGMFDEPYRPVFQGGWHEEEYDYRDEYPRRRFIEPPAIPPEAFDHARELARERLERFLRVIDPLFEDSEDLKKHVITTLLLERELGALRTHFQKDTFSKKEASQVFKGFLQSESTRTEELNLQEELDLLEKNLGTSPNWYDADLEKAILQTYEKLLRNVGVGESWERFCALVEYSGIDPADLVPPYSGLSGALRVLQAYIAEQGDLVRVAEVEQFTGQPFPEHIRKLCLKNAFKDICTNFEYELVHAVPSTIEAKMEERFTPFFAQGGQELSVTERIDVLKSIFQKVLLMLETDDRANPVLNLEQLLHVVVDRLGVPLSFFKQQLFPELQSFYVAQRYKRIFFFAERQPVLERIEQFTDVRQQPIGVEFEKQHVEKALQSPLSFTTGDLPSQLGPYLATRLPSLLALPGAREALTQAANKGLLTLARRTENAFLLQQLQAYQEAGLPVHLDPSSIEMWIGFRVKREGLLIDPLAYAEAFDCRMRQNYERDYERFIGEGHTQKTERGQMAKRILIAYFKDRREWGWAGVTAALEAEGSSFSLEDKFQIVRNLVHGLAIPTISLNTKRSFQRARIITVEDSINADAARFFKGIQALPFSDEQINTLTQEAYAMYALQNSVFLDTDLLEGLLPLQLDHPSVIAARARLTKSCLVEERPLTIDEPFYRRPALLSPSEWSEARFEEYIPIIQYLSERHYKEVIQEFREWHETDEHLADRLMEIFWQWREGHLDDQRLEQTLIINNAKIQLFRKNKTEFQESFEDLLAERISRGEWTLDQAQRRFRDPQEEFSPRMREEIVIKTVSSGNWFAIEALQKRYPGRENEILAWIKREVGSRLTTELKRSTDSSTQPWLAYVILHHSDVLIAQQTKEGFPWYEYQICLSHLYGKDAIPPDRFLKIPGIDVKSQVIQETIATEVLLKILSKGLRVVAPEAAVVDWTNPDILFLSDRIGRSYFPSLKVLREREDKNLEADIDRLKLFQETTGYFISDPRFWDLDSVRSVADIEVDIERWQRLSVLLGEKPTDREQVLKKAQASLDRLCGLGSETIAAFAALQKEYRLTPSDEALRLAVVEGLRPGRSLSWSMELLKTLGRSVEFSAENIRQIRPTEPRAEALIYMTLLPKSGPERAAAEKAYKERSPLAALIPQLLAIQGPTKRDEFCPYVHGLGSFVSQDRFTFKDETQNKGLLLYFKEFGMRYSRRLAFSIIELVEQLEGAPSPRDGHHLRELNTLLGVGEEKWPLEQYLREIHKMIAAIRQTILEDAPLDPRVEKSALGMELFNAVVPHTGSYQSVEDRPALLALTRVNQAGLVLEPWYKPGSKLVNVAEQEQASLKDREGSPVERQIYARQEQLKKKYQDETMNRFVRGWEEAARLFELEPTAQSRPFWFGMIRERLRLQIAALEIKRAETKNLHGNAALGTKIARFQQMDARVEVLMKGEKEKTQTDPTVEMLLEELQSLFVSSNGKVDRVELEAQVGDIARAFTLALMREHSSAHYEAVCTARDEQEEHKALSPKLITAWETWFREEYLEHFAGFNPDVDQPLSASTRFLLQKLWRIDGLEKDIVALRAGEVVKGMNAHPLIGPFLTIKRLEKEIEQLERTQQTGNQKPLQFWPVKRIGRVLAGDIANACYNKHRQRLAVGQERKLTALLMTIPGEVELAGSTLLIDTRTRSGKRVLVIRALNPTEAIIHKALDAQSVVEATIEYAKDVAKATQDSSQPIQEIRICYDHQGGHSTNRKEVYEAEVVLASKYGWQEGESLEDVSETRFNEYNIQGSSQTRVVWQAATVQLA